MTRVYAIVEGPTEESFVGGSLAEVLRPYEVVLTSIILGAPGHRGGRTKYVRVEKDILTQLKRDRRSYCTTMIDYYGLGTGFPGTPVPPHLNNVQKVEHIERAVKDDICRQIPGFRPDVRFIPYLSLQNTRVYSSAIRMPSLGRSASHTLPNVFTEFATTFQLRKRSTTIPKQHPRSE